MSVSTPVSPDVPAFFSPRPAGDSWAQCPDLIDAFRTGRVLAVPALTAEWSPTLICNMGCPLCPYGGSRQKAGHGRIRTGMFAEPDGMRTATWDIARATLDAFLAAGVKGLVATGGGEPTTWKDLPAALRYARRNGMETGLYTNAVQIALDPGLAFELLSEEVDLRFIRVSVGAVTDAVMRKHWGAVPEAVRPQFDALALLLEGRARLGRHTPAIQVSTIVDGANVGDLPGICAKVSEIFAPHRDVLSPEDALVVRPLTNHNRRRYSATDHDEATIRSVIGVCGQGGAGRRAVEAAGMQLHLGFGLGRIESGEVATYAELIHGEYAQRDVSWANGVFLTVGPDGSVYPSTEYNCNREWILGNLTTESVRDVYHGRRRIDALRVFQSVRWGPELSQPTARTARLDRIARAIQSGELSEQRIEQIRQLSLASHRLLLD